MRFDANALTSSIALLALLMPSSSAAQQGRPNDLARARALDREGAKAYGEGRYADAIRAFEEAYRLGGPAFELWNVAKCHLRLNQPEEAGAMLERYLSLPNLPKADRDEATKQLESLKSRLSKLSVSSTPVGAKVTVDGKHLGPAPVAVMVQPGTHSVTLEAPGSAPYSRVVEAKYGRAVVVDVLMGAAEDRRPESPPNPYEGAPGGSTAARAALWINIPRQGEVGGNIGPGLFVLGSHRVAQVGRVAIGAGGLASIATDSWGNRTGAPNEAPGCASPITHAQSATALSLFGVGRGSLPITQQIRVHGMAGIGLAAYAMDNAGGDLFVPSCTASPGVRPAAILGAEVDVAVSSTVRVSAFPLTWQLQPSFDGARAAPRDASGLWMRFGVGLGLGVDL